MGKQLDLVLEGIFNPAKHPRGRGGNWIDKLGGEAESHVMRGGRLVPKPKPVTLSLNDPLRKIQGRRNQPVGGSSKRRSLKPVIYDVPVAGPSPPDDLRNQFDYWKGMSKEHYDATDDVKRHVPAHVAAEIESVHVHTDPSQSSWNKEYDVKWKDGSSSGDQYEQDHDLGALYQDVARDWYTNKQQTQMAKIDLSKVRVGDKVHYVRNYDPKTDQYGEFKDVGTVVAKDQRGTPVVRSSEGKRLDKGYMMGGIFGHEPVSETERKKAVKSEVALQRAHQEKLRGLGQHDQADMNEIQVVRPLLRELGQKV